MKVGAANSPSSIQRAVLKFDLDPIHASVRVFLTRRATSGNVGRMTKKRLALIAVLPLTAAVIFGVLAMLSSNRGVTKARFDLIEKEMTREEVEQIFGREGSPFAKDGDVVWFRWDENDRSGAAIGFSHDRVVFKRWFDSPETIIDKIRGWLHLR
jgi:hypothetical protein